MNLINNMDNFLNLVYDDWPKDQEFPNANRPINPAFWIDEDIKHYNFVTSYESMSAFKSVKIKNYKIEDVKNNPDMVFYYQVWSQSDLFIPFFRKNILPINASVIDYIKTYKNIYLIFMNQVEAVGEESLKNLNEILLNNEIDASKVWIITNNEKIEKYKEELNTNINVYSSKAMAQYTRNNVKISFKYDTNSEFFICHNRMPRIHRYGILCLLKKYDILHDVDWSLLNGWEKDYSQHMLDYSNIFTDSDISDLKNEIEFFSEIKKVKSKYELNYTNYDDDSNQIDFEDINTHENCYVNIVTETNFLDEVIHITEKSFKPFWFFEFPLILASHEHIKYMKDIYGFDFFEDVIDYSYDSIKNNRDRLFAFANEIKRVHENKKFFIEFYKNNEDRFIKNHNILFEYENDIDCEFFKNLNLPKRLQFRNKKHK